jgi:putative thioredoxin
MSEHIVTLTAENLEQIVLQESLKRPVVIDFWADWCAPCKMLMPILEKLANEYNGQFLLAKLDTEAEPAVAAQFGVRNLPTVAIFKDGQAVDGFAGAQPESAIREILDKHLPKPFEALFQQGLTLLGEGDAAGALPLLKEAYTQSDSRADIAMTLAQAYLALKRFEDARHVLEGVEFIDQNDFYQSLLAQLDLAEQAAETPEILELQQQLEQSPDNLELKYELSIQYNQSGKQREAMELLVEILRKDLQFNDGAARKALVEMIQSLGGGDPLAAEFQRKLYTLLY